jgi:hypothetical protein
MVWVSASQRESLVSARMQRLRLTHPDLDFYVDVTVEEHDGRYMAAADLGEDSARSRGVGNTPQEAVSAALRSLGEPNATEIAEDVDSLKGW